MAFLSKAKLVDLLVLTEDLGLSAVENPRKLELIKAIKAVEEVKEEEKKLMLDQIISDRMEKEKEKERELQVQREEKEKERELQLRREEKEKERELQLQKEEKERELQLQREERELQLQREERELQLQREEAARAFELEKMRLELEAKKIEAERNTGNQLNDSRHSDMSVRGETIMKKIMTSFDDKNGDISLFLVRFENQAKTLNISEDKWVSQLMTLLPTESVDMITRDCQEDLHNYEKVKGLLMKKYKLGPEQFRQKFVKLQRNEEKSWQDFLHELKMNMNEWVEGLGITTYEGLKDLFLVDQMKKRVNEDAREHFIDKWDKIVSSSELAEMLDSYEVNRGYKRLASKSSKDFRRYDKKKTEEKKREEEKRTVPKQLFVKNFSSRDPYQRKKDAATHDNDDWFERRRQRLCYECGSPNHLRPQCPKLVKPSSHVNRVRVLEEERCSAPYKSVATVNGTKMTVLRDTGASIDIIGRKYVDIDQMTGEVVWVKSPLDIELKCLPLAKISLKGDFGEVETEAAVLPAELKEEIYILGNKTAELLPVKTWPIMDIKPQMIAAVQTRSKTKALEVEEEEKESSEEIEENDTSGQLEIHPQQLNQEEDAFILPLVDETCNEILQVNRQDLIAKQKEDGDLKKMFENIKDIKEVNNDSKEFFTIENEVLIKGVTDKHNNLKKLIVIPTEYRQKILKLCHENTSGHFGHKKTKTRLNNCFFWPRCHKNVENFVRTCDKCQRAGNYKDKRKAPMTQVPVITEIFSKLNVDACGPLPRTFSNNRYLITAICMASKYPEAIPVEDIRSKTVTNALLEIFSRLGYPKEIQTDQGGSFTSELTLSFFEKMGIKITHSSVYHPQSNPVERFHRTLKKILRTVCLESKEDWDEKIPQALFAIRTITNESTGFSPAELVFGKNLRTPEALLYESWLEKEEESTPVTEYILQLINRLKRYKEIALENMHDMSARNKRLYDRNAVKRDFKVGDSVLIFAMNKENKLSPNWTGPGKIISKISDTNYVVGEIEPYNKTQLYHSNMLKPYYQREEVVNCIKIRKQEDEELSEELDIILLDTNDTEFNFKEFLKFSLTELEDRLNDLQIKQLRKVLTKFKHSFSNLPGKTNLVEHDIELNSDNVIKVRPYKTSPRQNRILKEEIEKMLKMEIIEEAESDYVSPMILVETPGKDPRPCVDYRKLNQITKTQYFPLPNIEDRLEKVSAAKFITILDLSKGYWQIPLSERAKRYAAFVTQFGTYRPLRMSFGLKNAPYFFCKLMSTLFKGYEDFAVPYLDDIAIFSTSWEDHLLHLEKVLKKISEAQLTIKPSKCQFAKNEVVYLGHIVGQGHRKPNDIKVQSIVKYPIPATKKEVRAFLGLAGYYSRYIPNYAAIAAPLTDTLKGRNRKGPIKWSEECEKAFQELKKALSTPPVLYAPDFKKEFFVQTDASERGIGVALTQFEGPEEHPILFLSQKFSQTQQKYSTTEKECAAVVFAIKRLRPYLDGQKFTLLTDHNPLKWLQKRASDNARLNRWSLALQPFNFEVKHKPGKQHINVDVLSRNPA